MSSTIPARSSTRLRHARPICQGAEDTTTEATGMFVRCRQCGTNNPPERKFCANCGGNLWEPCPSCGTVNGTGVKFCGTCGANLGEVLQQQIEKCETALRDAQQLQAEERFTEAIDLLVPLMKTRHPRLAEHIDRARQLVKQLSAQRQGCGVVAQEAAATAEQCFSAQNYAEAVRVLEDLPPASQSDAMRQLLAESQSRLQQIALLNKQLREAIHGKRLEGVLPKLDRLLALKTDHAQARQLSERLQDRLCRSAQAKLAACQYEEALKLLDQIPESLRTGPAAKLHERAAELAWMSRDVRTAPVVDRALLAIAQHVQKAAPGDAQAAKACEEMRRRAQLGPKAPQSLVVPWAAPPETSYLGLPVDWLTGFQRISLAADFDGAPLTEYPGCFHVACGLALQGLGQGSLRINLLPRDSSTTFAKLGKLMRARWNASTRTAWGIDVGSSALKAVKLRWQESEQLAVMEVAYFREHRKPLSQAANEVEQGVVLLESLKSLLSQQDLKADRLCVSLSGRMVLSRQFQVPPAVKGKLRDLVRYEARSQLPFDLEKVAWDFQLLDAADARPPSNKGSSSGKQFAAHENRNVLLAAAKCGQVSRMLHIFHQAGLHVDVVQSDCLAMHNLLSHDYFGGEPRTEQPAATSSSVLGALDIGSDSAHVILSSPGLVWSTTIGFGGQSFTRALVRDLRLTSAQAETLKRNPAQTGSLSQLYRTLTPMFEDLAGEIRLALHAFNNVHPDQPVERLLGLGGGFRLHGLLGYLRFGR